MENISPKTTDEILNSPTLLNDFVDDTERLGHRGERQNKKILLMTFASSRREKPIQSNVQGESGSGKSSAVDTIRKFIPKEYVINLSAISDAGLWNLPKDAVKNKTIIIAEKSGISGADYSIRTLQSEGRLSRFVAVQQEFGWKTVEQIVEGPCAFIQTTTSLQSDRNAENESRTFVLHSDDSEELTREVFEAQKNRYQLKSNFNKNDANLLYQAWQSAFKRLESLRVVIPYTGLIKFPTKPVRVRRDHDRFLALIELSTHLYQFQRKREKDGAEDVIIAEAQDYRVAYDLFTPLMESNIEQISPKLNELNEKLRNCNAKTFTYAFAKELIGWERKTVKKYVNEGMEAGFFHAPKGIRNGVETHFHLADLSKKLSKQLSILTPDELDRMLKLSSCPNGLDRSVDRLINYETST